MRSTRGRSPEPTRATGLACPAQATRPPLNLASAVLFYNRHPHFHSFATHPAVGGAGYDIRTIQELLGHKDVKTTMVYTHVLNRGGRGVRSPVDSLVLLLRRGDRRKPDNTPMKLEKAA